MYLNVRMAQFAMCLSYLLRTFGAFCHAKTGVNEDLEKARRKLSNPKEWIDFTS